MKRMLLCIGIVLVVATVAFADKWWTDANWCTWKCVEDKDGSITITGVRARKNGAITIPTTLRGIPVTRIKAEAFYDNALLTDVTIPGNIVSIGDRAFAKCRNLKNLTFLDGVRQIEGNDAFRWCTSLHTVTIPKSLNYFRCRTFRDCFNIKRVNVDSVEAYLAIRFGTGSATPFCCTKACLYTNNVKIADLVIPKGITEIKNCSFCGANGMRSIFIPESVTNLGCESFKCDPATSIIISSDISVLNLAPNVSGNANEVGKFAPFKVLPKNGHPFEKWVDKWGNEVKNPFISPDPITVIPCWKGMGVNKVRKPRSI
jgi:hypothetical protein